MEPVRRNNSFSNAELAIIVGNIVSYMNRDLTELSNRGVTQTNIDDFEALGNAFEIFPSDEIYQAEIGIVAEEKKTLRESCLLKIQFISGFFEQKWDVNSPYYKQLGIKYLHNSKDADFLLACRRVVQVSETRLSSLTAEGLTQADIDSLNTEAQSFEDKIHLISSKTAEREIKTQERTVLANELFVELQKYSKIGKLVWENVDEAKYNDYVLYKTVHSGLPKPQGLSVELDPIVTNQANLIWYSVQDATEYELYASQVSSGQPHGEFSLVNTVLLPEDSQILQPNFIYYYKVRAKSADKISEFSEIVSIELPSGE